MVLSEWYDPSKQLPPSGISWQPTHGLYAYAALAAQLGPPTAYDIRRALQTLSRAVCRWICLRRWKRGTTTRRGRWRDGHGGDDLAQDAMIVVKRTAS